MRTSRRLGPAAVAAVALLLACGSSEEPLRTDVRAMTSDDAGARRAAVEALAAAPAESTRSAAVLVDALDDDDSQVRKAAGAAVRDLAERALEEVARFALDREDPARERFLEITEMVGKLGANVMPADLCMPLVVRAEHGRTPAERRAGALNLALADLPYAGDLVLDVLAMTLDDEDPDVRRMAAAGIGLRGWLALRDRDREAPPVPRELREAAEEGDPVAQLVTARMTATGDAAPSPSRAPFRSEELPRLLDDLEEALDRCSRNSWPFPGREQDLIVLIERLAATGPAADEWEALPLLRRIVETRCDEAYGANRIRFAAAEAVGAIRPGKPDHAEALGVLVREQRITMRALHRLAELGPEARPVLPIFVEMLSRGPDKDYGRGRLTAEIVRLGPNFGLVRRQKRAAALIVGNLGPAGVAAADSLRAHVDSDDALLAYRAARALRLIRRQGGGHRGR